MLYSLYKLKFTTPVHFGNSDSALSLYSSMDHFCADTLFSAMCHTALSMGGEEKLQSLCSSAQNGEFCMSDAMPFCKDELYFPKPYIASRHSKEVPADIRKSIKKMHWVAWSDFEKFLTSVRTGAIYRPQSIRFGEYGEQIRVALSEESVPYSVGNFVFEDGCGLYFVLGCSNESIRTEISKIMEWMGSTGIGGKVSSGYGKFYIDEIVELEKSDQAVMKRLNKGLTRESAKHQLLLTTSLPQKDEIESTIDGAWFQLVRRSGFIQSGNYAQTALKKQTQYFLCAGSVLEKKFKGTLYSLENEGGHPIYRFSQPVFLGVDL